MHVVKEEWVGREMKAEGVTYLSFRKEGQKKVLGVDGRGLGDYSRGPQPQAWTDTCCQIANCCLIAGSNIGLNKVHRECNALEIS